MNDDERQILTDIQVNSAVTREKVEGLSEDFSDLNQIQTDHEKRLSAVESDSARNSYILTGVAGTVGAGMATLVAKITQFL